MNDFENKMNRAAEELRQSTRSLTPPPAPGRHLLSAPARRGWLIFAAAFAVVAVTIGVLPLLDRDPTIPVGGSSTTSPVEPPSTVPPTTVATTVPTTECSATGVPAPDEQTGLPDVIAAKRQAIIDAAMACDFDALVALAGEPFTTSFGGGDASLLEEWEAAGEGKLGILLQILDMSHATVGTGDGDTYYAWPAAYAYDSWDDITDEHMEELRAIYTDEELEQLSLMGVYAGWRTGIRADGTWRYFVAGD